MNYQQRVALWILACFDQKTLFDKIERNYRFIEEAIELVQALGCSRSDTHMLVEYVFNRPIGEPRQEVGGVLVTLAALCHANEIDMEHEGMMELLRIEEPNTMEKIRVKQATKPKNSPQ